MGLLLSVLVGCVGVLELLDCFRHISHGLYVSSIDPPAACLSYHSSMSEKLSSRDSLCVIGHSRDSGVTRAARRKLENLHEYSLRVRSELRVLDKHFDLESTLSDCSTREVFGSSRPDSRLSLDDLVYEDKEWSVGGLRAISSPEIGRIDSSKEMVVRKAMTESPESSILLNLPTQQTYTRLPTPVPPDLIDGASKSGSNSPSDRVNSFENDSGNEMPTRMSFEHLSGVGRPDYRYEFPSVNGIVDDRRPSDEPADLTKSSDVRDSLFGNRKKSKSSTTILRKATRLKSRYAEVSKSAENLNARKSSRRHREAERRKSDISVQVVDFDSIVRDQATNTSPIGSRSGSSSRLESRRSVSVEVQTIGIEDGLSSEDEGLAGPMGLSESSKNLASCKRDSFGKRSFKNRRFGSSLEDCTNVVWVTSARPILEKKFSYVRHPPPRISSFEEASEDDYERIRNVVLEINGRQSDPDDKSERSRKYEATTNGSLNPKMSCLEGEPEVLTMTSDDSIDDDEFVDADEGDVPSLLRTPIEYSFPDTGANKAFWLIFSGEYTKAMNKDWHSGHFCCWQCDESLTGQRYVLRDEHPYCIKCYESVFANGCEECNKIIGIDSKDLSYKDKHWHEACFLCNKCRVSLVDKQFGSKVDKIYCGNCYDAQFASRCDGCGEIFRAGTKKMEYKTRQWHEKCFCCVVCKNPIGTKSFIPREQEIYCAGCYEDKFATRCVKCNKIITSGGVTYKNEPWHRDCFTCSNCNNSLAGQRFTSRDEKPYCADCFGELFAKRCTACTKPITGIGGTRFISFEDRHWHNDCFICAGCKTSLVGRGFITDGDDIICPECAKQKVM